MKIGGFVMTKPTRLNSVYTLTMTRINVGVKPRELSNKHLLSEHREIKRIPNKIRSGKYVLKGKPEEFKLGEGHVKFFYDKLLYLKKRYLKIYAECIKRRFKVTYYGGSWKDLPDELLNDYEEREVDRNIILQRIKSKSK